MRGMDREKEKRRVMPTVEMNLEVIKQLELKTYNLVEKRRLFCYWC